jgi:hypothetical protein
MTRVQSDLEGDRQVLAFARSAIELALRVVKLVSRLQWKDGFGAHSGPSRGDYSRRAFRPTEASKATNVMSGLRRFETSLKRLKCANSGHTRTAWRTGQIDPFATFRVAEQNDCFGATSGHSWVHFDSRSRARPSALGLGATLPGAKPA